jgi:hypothetical protein
MRWIAAAVAGSWTKAPSASASPALSTFTSPLYGYSVEHPATERWAFGTDAAPFGLTADRFLSAPSGGFVLTWVAAQPAPDGMTAEGWMADYATRAAATDRPCRAEPDQWAAREIGGSPGRFVSVMCATPHGEAVVVIDGVGYVINGDGVPVETVLGSFQAP